MRLGLSALLLMGALAGFPGCGPRGYGRFDCVTPDCKPVLCGGPDCDFGCVSDNDCLPGEACILNNCRNASLGADCRTTGHAGCLSGICLEFEQGSASALCTGTCQRDRDCENSFARMECFAGRCRPSRGCECKEEGESCGVQPGECRRELICSRATPAAPEPVCVRPCDPARGCGEGAQCVEDVSGNRVCSSARPLLRLGDDCSAQGGAGCAEGECVAIRSGLIQYRCATACEQDTDCPEFFGCQRLDDLDEGRCAAAPLGRGQRTGGLGNSCGKGRDTDCRPGLFCYWHERDPESAFCTRDCDDKAPCPEGSVCRKASGGVTVCFPGPKGGGAGTPCAGGGAAECAEGLLCLSRFRDDPFARCTARCGANLPACPEGAVCSDPGGLGICYAKQPGAGRGGVGDPCPGGTNDCVTGVCLSDQSGFAVCSRDCSTRGECPPDFDCQALRGSPVKFCIPPFFQPP
ncbi:MAG: hypothetical protein GMKNLPBB_01974 [Myxococcota bacterium]|nr:hypothetical protein [Myxococcota bacterium]